MSITETLPAERLPIARGRKRPRTSVMRLVLGGAAVVLVITLGTTGISLARAFAAPGGDAIGTKFVEWVRGHGGNGVVNQVENWWYSQHQPPRGGQPNGNRLPTAAPPAVTTPTTRPRLLPQNVVPLASPPLPNEGMWQPTGKLVNGAAAVYSTYLRPDPVHTSLVAGAMWLDTSRLRAVLYNGLEVPGGGPWQRGARVQPADSSSLVAAFNGGFKLDASQGGYYTEGQTVRPLVVGRASLVFRTDGTAAVGMWGRDFQAGPDIASVRQNLDLLVDNGAPAAGLDANDTTRWGATLGNQIYVWRSGVCTDRTGNIIYVGGPGLNVASLAGIEVAAGCVRGMELDINTDWVTGYTFTGGGPSAPLQGHKLLDNMVRPEDRYLNDGTRDFIALFSRQP